MSHLSWDIANADTSFLNVVFVEMISELQGDFQQFFYFEI